MSFKTPNYFSILRDSTRRLETPSASRLEEGRTDWRRARRGPLVIARGAGVSWSQLESAGASWRQLESAGTVSWSELKSAGATIGSELESAGVW